MRFEQLFNILSGGVGSFFLPKYNPYSRLLIKSDGSSWVLNSIANEMQHIVNRIGINTIDSKYFRFIKNQSIFFTSKYSVLSNWKIPKNKIAFPYYHGDPSSNNDFYKMIKIIENNHKYISRIQVSHSQMEKTILNTGIDQNKVLSAISPLKDVDGMNPLNSGKVFQNNNIHFIVLKMPKN